jgi:drug/metabolite transporter (DMT)-like permease
MNKKQNNRVAGILAGLASALCVSGYFIINKHVYNTYDITAIQYSLLFAVIGGLYALTSLVLQSKNSDRKEVRQHTTSFGILGAAGFLAVGMLVFGQQFTTSINASILVTATIVTTAFFSFVMLKEKLDKSQWLWIAVLFLGLYIGIVGFKTLTLRIGDVIVLGSVIVFGFGNVYSRIIMKKVTKPSMVPDVRLLIAGTIALILTPLLVRDYKVMVDVLPWAFAAGFFYWLCMKFFAKSVHLLNANEAIILNNSQIFFTSLLGVVLLSEPYSIEKFIGSVIVLISIYFISVYNKRS